jgi:hypothetical protein
MTKTEATAVALAERTADAYSRDRFLSWTSVAKFLLDYGYSEREAEAIMRSKYMRWAADAAGVDLASAQCAVDYAAQHITKRELASLVEATFRSF